MFHHFVLSGVDIIRNAVEPDLSGFTIIHSITGSGVTISGLSHTTGINNQSVLTQGKLDICPEVAGRTNTIFIITEYLWYMGMTY